jgi:anti-anti-sigma factor
VKPFVLLIASSRSKTKGPRGPNHAEEKIILGELDKWMAGVSRPRVVLDCSQLEEMGQPEVRLLVSCLERVMKRNGDARLAGVSQKALETLVCTGAERLFRIYDSREAALRSYESQSNFELVGEIRRNNLRGARDEGGRASASSFQYNALRQSGVENE